LIIQGINSSIPPLTVLNKNGLHIIFNFEKQDKILLIHLQATNSTQIPITNFVFKAAVPKVKNSCSYFFLTKQNRLFRQLILIYFLQVVQQFHQIILEMFVKQ